MELQPVVLTIEIEPVALRLLQQQAEWQGLTLDQLVAYYVSRCAALIETQHGNALVGDAFDGLRARNLPQRLKPADEP